MTLVTGDRVLVDPKGRVSSVEPGPGRKRISFSILERRGRVRVVPADAAPLIASGTVDERLFDVSALLDADYDDAHRADLPLIVRYAGAQPRSGVPQGVTQVRPTRSLAPLRGVAVTASKRQGGPDLWDSIMHADRTARAASRVDKLWLDGRVKATLDRSAPQIGAPSAWAAGLTGAGVKVAVLDTGVDQTHPDLAEREIAERNFTDTPDAVDRVGHGTHVASILAGSGARSGGRFRGIASGASLLDYKVLNDDGFGQESWIVDAMWAAADQGARIVSMSLGGADLDGIDPLEEAVNTISAERGTLFVVAAGNSGPSAETINSPGSADAALTVGAVDRDDSIAPFSSRGPRRDDGAVKPDITAPGVGIVAAKAANDFIGGVAPDGYSTLSGTSMATPHVAGAAAILAQQHPDWSGSQLKSALTSSARPTAGASLFAQGSGRVDIARAITQTVTAEPAGVNFGAQPWPHDDDQPITRTVTYHNFGAAEVTLDLAVSAAGPDGAPAAAGLLAVSPQRVTVPAGGQARATVTADTRVGTADGVFTGAVVASGGAVTVRTPLTVVREAATHTLTLRHLDRNGDTPQGFFDTTIVGLDTGGGFFSPGRSPTATVRLPVGRYAVFSEISTRRADGTEDVAKLLYPELSFTGDTTIDLDARKAKPFLITPPDPAATSSPLGGILGFERLLNGNGIGHLGWVEDLSKMYTAQLGPDPTGTMRSVVHGVWTGSQTPDHTTAYRLAFPRTGSFFTGLTRTVSKRELARIDMVATTGRRTGTIGSVWAAAYLPDGFRVVGPTGEFHQAQHAYTWYITANGLRWEWGSRQDAVLPDIGVQATELEVLSGVETYRAGQRYQRRMNFPVYGLAVWDQPGQGLERFGDRVSVNLGIFGDGEGNVVIWPPGYAVGTATLYRDGSKLDDSDRPDVAQFLVPADSARYRLEIAATPRWAHLSKTTTSLSAAWTFRSSRTTGSQPVRLPLSMIRFSPAVDASGHAAAGRTLVIPVTVAHLPGDGSGRLARLSAEVSYDDGRTWTKAKTIGNGSALIVHHPRRAGFVSLRASATDSRGNTAEQTIIRAYELSAR